MDWKPYTIVSADWLKAHLGDPDIQVIDGTSYTPGQGKDGDVEHARERIPGSVFLDLYKVVDRTPGPPTRMLPPPEVFAADVGALGIRPDAHLVVYDAIGLYSAARVWWMFKVYGHERISVLDGGLPAWKAAGGALASGPDAPAAPTTWPLPKKATEVRGWQQIRDNISTRSEIVVDVRPPAMFNGDTSHIYPGVRSGHIPGSVNLSQRTLLHPDGRYLDRDAMLARFKEVGVDVNGPIVATCGSGITACILALALDMLRGQRAPVYDGSWEEWGGRADLPVENG